MASLCLATGVANYQMALLANLAAGLVCERVGVVPVEREWLEAFTWADLESEKLKTKN
jgi:bifunctional ADP-heptose synthase (sugar kinase/adenylyltransferase)